MKRIRIGLFILSAVLLGLGYCASQFAWFNQNFVSYAAWIDRPEVARVSFVLLISWVVFALIKQDGDHESSGTQPQGQTNKSGQEG